MTRPTEAGSFRGGHLLSIRQLNRTDFEELFDLADRARLTGSSALQGKVLVSAFFDHSTRTRLSHETAMLRLGGSVTGFAEPSTTRVGGSSRESCEDVLTMARIYGDVVVVRHRQTGWIHDALPAAGGSGLVINGGDGRGEHPTQTLADLYTMRQLGLDLDTVKVLLLNDLRMRCIRTLLMALENFREPKVIVLDADADQVEHGPHLNVRRVTCLEEALSLADVAYVSPTVGVDDDTQEAGRCVDTVLDDKIVTAIDPEYRIKIMHPLPRGPELSSALDSTGSNAYWLQARAGIAVRMALLQLMLNATP